MQIFSSQYWFLYSCNAMTAPRWCWPWVVMLTSSPNTLFASSANASDLTISQLFDPFTRYPNFSPSLLNCMYHLYNCAILPPPAESSASHTCLTIRQCACCEDNKRYFGLENSRFNFHLDSSDNSDNYLEKLTACELQNKSNCQSKKWNLITPKPTRTIAWRVTQSVFCPFPPPHTGR